jgi:glycosyltransferase involved in cell wall biosynthesis
MSEYAALIRTFNSAATLTVTLKTLSRQSTPPHQYVIVDSGSSDATLDLVPGDALVHRYEGDAFNYAEALNQGLRHVSTEYVLIISSHTWLAKTGAIEYGLGLLQSDRGLAGVCYIEGPRAADLDDFRHQLAGRESFSGFNGLSSSCALVRSDLLRRRPFRPEVFSAEDQEWSRWAIESEGLTIARIHCAGMVNDNPRKWSRRKRLNEYVAVAYYVNRELLGWAHLRQVATRVLRQPGPRVRERLLNVELLVRLLACRIRPPRGQSRYFRPPKVKQRSIGISARPGPRAPP